MIYKTKYLYSDINGKIKIVTNKITGKSSVAVGGLHQSGQLLINLWKQVIKRLPRAFQPAKILLLGGGGGSLFPLIKKFYPQLAITAVEKDPVMWSLAQELYPQFAQSTKAIITDAQNYVKESQEKFDLILVDLYVGKDIPEFVYTPDFILACRKLLTKEGFLIISFPVYEGRDLLLDNSWRSQKEFGLSPTIVETNTTHFAIYSK